MLSNTPVWNLPNPDPTSSSVLPSCRLIDHNPACLVPIPCEQVWIRRHSTRHNSVRVSGAIAFTDCGHATGAVLIWCMRPFGDLTQQVPCNHEPIDPSIKQVQCGCERESSAANQPPRCARLGPLRPVVGNMGPHPSASHAGVQPGRSKCESRHHRSFHPATPSHLESVSFFQTFLWFAQMSSSGMAEIIMSCKKLSKSGVKVEIVDNETSSSKMSFLLIHLILRSLLSECHRRADAHTHSIDTHSFILGNGRCSL